MSFLKKYQSIIVASILIVIFMTGLSLLLKPAGKTGFLKKMVLEVAIPVESMVNLSIRAIGEVWNRYLFLVGLEEENKTLKKRISSLTGAINAHRETYLQCARLRKLLNLQESSHFQTIAAKVVGRERASVFKTILINKGTSDGLRIGLPVLAPEGVAGKIIDVSWNVSIVLLITDYNSNIDALIQDTRAQGILQGDGSKGCVLKYVQRSEKVNVGDSVVCSGLARIFPKGLLLGTVVNADKEEIGLFQKIQIAPAVDVTRLEEVLVVLKKRNGSDE
ncbi:MAG: rod shape-determining protein MreC [Syntrophobacterales bacterium]|nr:rod shape-determining protein MreC [Syntrophobacterales bacterium]